VISFYQEPQKQMFNFCYINCNKNYLINYVNRLFQNKSAIMFSNNEQFIIHPSNKLCGQDQSNPLHSDINPSLEFVKNTYPKQKFLPIVISRLTSLGLLDKNMFFLDFPNVHLADFCSFINNKFSKTNTADSRYLKLCKYLQSKSVKCPKVSIKNPVAQKYLC